MSLTCKTKYWWISVHSDIPSYWLIHPVQFRTCPYIPTWGQKRTRREGKSKKKKAFLCPALYWANQNNRDPVLPLNPSLAAATHRANLQQSSSNSSSRVEPANLPLLPLPTSPFPQRGPGKSCHARMQIVFHHPAINRQGGAGYSWCTYSQ